MSFKRTLLATAAIMMAMSGLAATPAHAEDTTDALLIRLKEKGILSEAEFNELSARRRTEIQVTPPAPAATPQAAAAAALDDKKLVRMMDGGGVGLQLGPVNLKMSGSINAFYTHESGQGPAANRIVAGGLVAPGDDTSAIRNGLLPGFLKFDVTTNQGGWDIGAHFGMYPGINSVTGVGGANSGGSPAALSTAGIDFRQTYITAGRPGFGEVKLGRDIGLFASEAILNDITLLSVGTPGNNPAPSNTSLGRIGAGYIYTDFQPQITYTTPKFGGLQLSAGIFQPLQTLGSTAFEVNGRPGFQGKATYDFKAGDVGAHLWLSGLTQRHENGALGNYTGRAVDGGAKLSFGPGTLTGYYYTGRGAGTTGLFLLSTDALGNPRKSNGYYIQGTLGFGKITAGASYGRSSINLTSAERADRASVLLSGNYSPLLVDHNESYVGQLRYGLTDWMTLISEWTHSRSVATGGNKASSDALALGSILFF